MDYEKLYKQELVEAMDPIERNKKYKNGEMVDCIPYTFHGVDMALAENMGYTTSEFNNDFDVFSEVVKFREDILGIYGTNIRLTLKTIGVAVGSEIEVPEHGISSITNHVLKDYNEFEKLEISDPYNNKTLTPLLEKAKLFKQHFPDRLVSTGVVGPISTAVSIRPIDMILRDTRRDLDNLNSLLDFCLEASLKWVEVFTKEVGKSRTSISDPVSCSDILSEKQFREISFPKLKKLSEGIYDITGYRPTLHVCGHTKPIWKYFPQLKISSFSVDNCEDIGELKEALGEYMEIVGNVPPVEVIRNGTPEEVIESCRNTVKKASDSPKGYTISSGCQIPLGTKLENIYAYLYAVRKFGKNAMIGELPEGILH